MPDIPKKDPGPVRKNDQRDHRKRIKVINTIKKLKLGLWAANFKLKG
jgi:hypothetical protein